MIYIATLLIGDSAFNDRIVCDGSIDTECTKFINYGDGVEVIHLYVSDEYISKSSFQLYTRTVGSTEDWILDFEMQVGGFYDYVWQGIYIFGENNEYKITYKGLTKYYTVTSPCTPNWQCRQPRDGYETDLNSCGEPDRYNEDCVGCIPNWQCRQPQDGYETDLNSCGEPDRYNEDCDIVIVCRKGCAIDGSYDYYTGNMIGGECEVIENSELCGYVPPEDSSNVKYLIIGGFGVLGVAMLLQSARLSKNSRMNLVA